MKLASLFLQIRTHNPIVLSVGLVLVFGGVFTVLIMDTTNWWNLSLIALGLILLGLFLAANLTQVKETGKKRTTVTRANLALVAIAILGIVFGLNYIVARHPVRFDLTSNKFFTLADQTLTSLKGLKQDVEVTFFISSKRSSAEVQKAQQLLEEYAKKSTRFHFKVVDGDRNPTEAKKLSVREPNTVVFICGENRKDVLQKDYITYAMTGRQPTPKFQGEGAFTAALIKMSDTSHLTFYLVEGHGERDMNNPQPDGINLFKDILEKQNYTVKTLNLLTTGKVPEDAAVLGVLGPARAFQPSEVALLGGYLKQGGKLVLCVDPVVKSGLDSLLRDYGVHLGDDLVVDTVSHNYINVQEVIPQYLSHPIVEKLSDSHIASVMPYSRSVQKKEPLLKNVTQNIFLQTTDKGWGETNLKSKSLKYDAGIDTKGPAPMAIACEWNSPEVPGKNTRLVVYGNASFLSNQYVQAGGNEDLAVNSFSWAAVEENKISIHPKEEDVRMVELSNVSAKFIFYLTVIIMPLAILVTGVLVWYRRRSL